MPYEGEPTNARILFWSGDVGVVVRDRPISVSGVKFILYAFFPTEQLKWRYPDTVNDEFLKFDISEVGMIFRAYPAEYIIPLTSNPESPWLLGLCNFDGSITFDHDIKVKSQKVISLESVIDSLTTENHRLRRKLKEARSYSKELK